MRLRRLRPDEVDWDELRSFPDRTLFQGPEWLAFLERTQGGEVVLAALEDGDDVLGYFTGMVSRRMGLRILGSPMYGWSTAYMGFNVLDEAARPAALAALARFAFDDLRCLHLEVRDRFMPFGAGPAVGYEESTYGGYEVDLGPDDDTLFGAMSSACRRCIRKADKSGVVVNEATDRAAFATEYHRQLTDVFAKQGLTPTYGVDRVRALVETVPASHLLLVEARDPDGTPIASGIFPAGEGRMYFWGGASWRSGQHLRPNEAVQWFAMRHWKERGIDAYDMGGGGQYKEKYGGAPLEVPLLWRSRNRLVSGARSRASAAVGVLQRTRARLPTR